MYLVAIIETGVMSHSRAASSTALYGKLIFQQYPDLNAVNAPHQCLASPHLHEELVRPS